MARYLRKVTDNSITVVADDDDQTLHTLLSQVTSGADVPAHSSPKPLYEETSEAWVLQHGGTSSHPAQSGSGVTPITATFTGSPRAATGVLADDDAWQNTTGGFALVFLDRQAFVAADAPGYAAAWSAGGTVGDSYFASNIGLVLVPPNFYAVIDTRVVDSYPGILL